MNKKHIFYISIAAFVLQIANLIVFFQMHEYMTSAMISNIDFVMYYLSIILIIASFIIELVVYQLRKTQTKKKEILMSIIFYVMLIIVAIFIATFIFVFRQ